MSACTMNIYSAYKGTFVSFNNQPNDEKRIQLNTTISPEAFGLIKAESQRVNQPIGEILDRLILDGCQINERLPYESHTTELEEAKKRLDVRFGKIDLV
ncbi:hypothetical protein ACFL0D_07210 [Thermoproteota archaeon]